MSESTKYSFIEEALESRRKENRFRYLTAVQPEDQLIVQKEGKKLINFCSNDYLGLSRNPKVINRAIDYATRYGAGSTASRLVSGTFNIHHELEEKIARTFGTEAAMVFNSGFQANSSIIGTLTDRHSLILADTLSHNSLLQGSLLSRADFRRYDHNDISHLEELLKNAKGSYNRILIVTETVFSMDGDRSDLDSIVGLAEKYDALLFVDDAHAVGVWGERGLGLAVGMPGIDILLGTCGKAFGSFGSYVCCSGKMKEYLVNYCPGFIYTTALPPAVIGAIEAALDVIPGMKEQREAYRDTIGKVRNRLQTMGFNTGPSATQIIPLILGDDVSTISLSQYLEENGILATAIRPPTVPEKGSRIRITLSAAHTTEQIAHLLKVLQEWKDAQS